jgi:trans-aconitate 2-methyltransferase
MLDEACGALAQFSAQVTFVQTDLLDIDTALHARTVDAVFSTATFHWINDHARLFAALRHVLKPHGRLVSQFGGGSNLAELMNATDSVASRPAYTAELEGKKLWRYFTSPEDTIQRLEAAGFTDVAAWLEPSPQTFADEDAFVEFARAVVLRNHVNALPADRRESFEREVATEVQRRMGNYVLDYVRLNADAIAA